VTPWCARDIWRRPSRAFILCCLWLLFLFPGLAVAQETGALVEGTVVNALNGRQIPRTLVILRGFNGDTAVGRADDTGHFRIKNVSAGIYAVSADRQGFYTEKRGRRLLTIDVPESGTLGNLLIRLVPQAAVTGRILDEHTDVVHHAEVMLLGWEFHNGRRILRKKASAFTNDLGDYRIFPVQTGKYYVMASYNARAEFQKALAGANAGDSHHSDLASAPVFFPGTTDFREAREISIKPGDEFVTDFLLLSKPAVSIRGRVVNGLTGRPVPHPIVTALWSPVPAGLEPVTAKANDDGQFEIWGLAPGAFLLTATSGEDGGYYFGETQLEVSGLGATNAEIAVLPDFEVPGHVRIADEEKKAIQHISLLFTIVSGQSSGFSAVNVSGPDFLLSPRLHPETHYSVKASDLPRDDYLKTVTVAGKEVPAGDIVVHARQADLEFVISPNGGHIEGTVLTSRNEPVRDSLVMLIPDAGIGIIEPNAVRYIKSDAKGKVIFRGVAPGDYRILAWEEEVDPQELLAQADTLKSFAGQGDAIKVEEGGHYTIYPKLVLAESTF